MAFRNVTPAEIRGLGETWVAVGEILRRTADSLERHHIPEVELHWEQISGKLFDKIETATRKAIAETEMQIMATETARKRYAKRGR